MSRALGTTAFTFGTKPHTLRPEFRIYGFDPYNSADAVQVYAKVQPHSRAKREAKRIADALLAQAFGEQVRAGDWT